MPNEEIKAAIDWLIDGARSAPLPHQVLAQLCERLVAGGIPLWRVAVFVRTLHPNVMGRRFVWRPGAEVEAREAPYELLESSDFLDSTIARVYLTEEPIRRRLADPDCPLDFPILAELRAEGVTDYLASPLVFTDGAIHVVTCTTREPNGFTDEQIAGIEAIITPLARVAEVLALRRTASMLLDTYVGHDAGERILAGHIRRGDIEEIHAAIWLSDMRGFTALADTLPPRVMIDLLNRYFDCQVPVILRRGAEVLKFMGDGLLAIFTISGDETEVCKRALATAREVQANIAELASSAMPGLRFGLALHIGDVLYGNIGSGNRLDFTCIGPAVNCAARIEKLTAQLGRAILASGEFARHCPEEFTALGEFSLAGFSVPQAVFGLEETPS
jgi:adenylate cyclase